MNLAERRLDVGVRLVQSTFLRHARDYKTEPPEARCGLMSQVHARESMTGAQAAEALTS